MSVRVAALAGGTGAAKLLRGLAACVEPATITVIGNTGDDAEIWGLHVSPDLDSVMYALAGVLDTARGWGRGDETFHCLSAMAAYGAPTWFALGDRDLATHVARTQTLHAGKTLSATTASLARALGVSASLLPMSDDPVRTIIHTPDTRLAFQEYFVRDKALVDVLAVEYDGATAARPAPGVREALLDADLVVVCPSNPITSIGPILAVPGMRDALSQAAAPVVAVSPFVRGEVLKGPTEAFCRMAGLPLGTAAVERAYAGVIDGLVADEPGRLPAHVTDVLMDTPDARRRVAASALDLALSLRDGA
jgi:LPPG:FO 2-phospho-L-lactate transferase